MRERVRRAEDVRGWLGQVARPLLGRHHAGGATIGDHAAVEEVQRIGDQSRREHVIDRDRIAVLRQRVHGCVITHRHRDLCELLRGRPELVHVSSRGEGVAADEGVAPDRIRRARAGRRSSASAGTEGTPHLGQLRAPVGDEHDLGLAALDGGGRMLDEHLERRPTDVGLVEVVRPDAEVLTGLHRVQRQQADRRVPVDVLPRQAGVGQRTIGRDAVERELGHIGMVRIVGRGDTGDDRRRVLSPSRHSEGSPQRRTLP